MRTVSCSAGLLRRIIPHLHPYVQFIWNPLRDACRAVRSSHPSKSNFGGDPALPKKKAPAGEPELRRSKRSVLLSQRGRTPTNAADSGQIQPPLLPRTA